MNSDVLIIWYNLFFYYNFREEWVNCITAVNLNLPTGRNRAGDSSWWLHPCPQGSGSAAQSCQEVSADRSLMFWILDLLQIKLGYEKIGVLVQQVDLSVQRGAGEEHKCRWSGSYGRRVPGCCPQQGLQGQTFLHQRCRRLPHSGQCRAIHSVILLGKQI